MEAILWSPGNQFCFVDGWAWSSDPDLRQFYVPVEKLLPCLDGTQKYGNPTVDNLITMDNNQRSRR